jgi:hypothetical protein
LLSKRRRNRQYRAIALPLAKPALLLGDLTVPLDDRPVPIHYVAIEWDTQGALALAENDTSHRRSIRIAIKYHLVQEHVEVQEVHLHFVPGSENVADVLTKSLGGMKTQSFVTMMGVGPCF